MEPSPLPQEASIAGFSGSIVQEDAAAAIWEVKVAPGSVAGLLEACQVGTVIELFTVDRVVRALARQWWVLPVKSKLLVRVALEKAGEA